MKLLNGALMNERVTAIVDAEAEVKQWKATRTYQVDLTDFDKDERETLKEEGAVSGFVVSFTNATIKSDDRDKNPTYRGYAFYCDDGFWFYELDTGRLDPTLYSNCDAIKSNKNAWNIIKNKIRDEVDTYLKDNRFEYQDAKMEVRLDITPRGEILIRHLSFDFINAGGWKDYWENVVYRDMISDIKNSFVSQFRDTEMFRKGAKYAESRLRYEPLVVEAAFEIEYDTLKELATLTEFEVESDSETLKESAYKRYRIGWADFTVDYSRKKGLHHLYFDEWDRDFPQLVEQMSEKQVDEQFEQALLEALEMKELNVDWNKNYSFNGTCALNCSYWNDIIASDEEFIIEQLRIKELK